MKKLMSMALALSFLTAAVPMFAQDKTDTTKTKKSKSGKKSKKTGTMDDKKTS
ncbi:MAG TPA: hypothetical protein VKU01_20960 [Bryobacteraceae bacterium]|nr:hypothetical protein [Bryobacteraceae bacterium]